MAESIPEKDQFLTAYPNYVLRETVTYPNGGVSRFYDDGVDMVIIDDEICSCRDGEQIFPYTLITDKQNHYMKIYRRVFRFLGFDPETIEKCLQKNRQEVLHFTKKISERGEHADSSPLELLFEQNFTDVYGMRALKYLQKEFRISDEDGNNYFLDYLVDTADSRVAIEENGIHYHHPQLIGIEGYRKQLRKQNTCALWGLKLYRFSTEDCRFKDRIEDDIRSYLGKDTGGFREAGLLLERKTELYEHQEISLAQIQERREKGIRAFLIVLPTAAGKSRIVEEDIQKFAAGKEQFRALILAPNTNIIADWKERIDKDLQPLQDRIDIKTYSYAIRHYHEKTRDYYSYIVVDEAHHAVAPMLKRVIQYYAPEFLVGLTATDQRPDKKRLEEIFGNYTTELSLKDAMEKGVVARANVYRIETNIDLSHVRFNGKDYVNADLEKSVRVTSRNELIVNVLKDYFTEGDAGKRQGIIFCINKAHTKEMARLLNAAGISAQDYSGDTKHPEKVMQEFKEHKIRFLCACDMISEGWDYPELGILVMARPTLSKVLYLQQIGRGLRRTSIKKNVFVIDVVDEYGAMVRPCSMHAIFGNSLYVPFGDITRQDYLPGQMIEIDGITERVERIVEVDIHRINAFCDCYTVHDYIKNKNSNKIYDIVIVDECSTICNEDILQLLEKCNSEAYLLLGDIHQIEAIKFGNWFNFARYFIEKNSVYELSTPYRAKNNNTLLNMWSYVRHYDENMFERLQANGYISILDESIFEKTEDEIILCLGYDGLYGVNNINRYMQKVNLSNPIEWGNWVYKVGDKVLFNDNKRFGGVLYNNLKGTIVAIDRKAEEIVFQIQIDKKISDRAIFYTDLKLHDCACEGKSIVEFSVKKRIEKDSDTDYSEQVVPFQIAYAVSIHKAQGLEYKSVKVVITEDVDEQISHNIFYTAITRTTDKLKIYLSKETQKKLATKFVESNVGLKQAQIFAQHAGLKLKNKLSS